MSTTTPYSQNLIVQSLVADTRLFRFGVRSYTLVPGVNFTIPMEDPKVNPEIYKYALDWQARGILQIIAGPLGQLYDAAADQPAFGTVVVSGTTTNTTYTVTINGQVFQYASDPTGNSVLGAYNSNLSSTANVWAGAGAAQATAAATLVTAITNFAANNPSFPVSASPVYTPSAGSSYIALSASALNDVVVPAVAITLSSAGTNLAVSGATLANGTYGGAVRNIRSSYTVTAGDVTNGYINLPTGVNTIQGFSFNLFTATTWLQKAFNGNVKPVGGSVMVVQGTGSATTEFATGDVIYLSGWGQ